MSDFVKLYNPANAAALKPEQIEGLQRLTLEEIKQLATAYPNRVFNRGYILTKDKNNKVPIERQLPQLSTFENVYNNITKNNMKGLVIVSFKGQPQQKAIVRPKKSEVVDLSDAELMTLPGFKLAKTNGGEEVIAPEVVPVVKVKRGRPKVEKN